MPSDGIATALVRTGSWFSRLPDGHTLVGISRGTPRRPAGYRKYMKLAPNGWFNSVSPLQYKQLYQAEVLDKLNPAQVVRELLDMADGGVPVLACFEAPPPNPEWCHRALVSAWLYDTLGFEVYELGHEDCGCGWRHPKLHPSQAQQRNE